MELVKKIIVSILVVLGVAIAGLIICIGVMIAWPNVKIFGYSYLNTTASIDETIINGDIANMKSYSGENFLFNIETLDFNVVIVPNNVHDDKIDFIVTNHVFGFTNSMDSNKLAKLNINYDSANKTMNITMNEPSGIFFKAERILKIEIPENFYNSNQISLKTKTNNGVITLGETGKNTINFKDVESTCDSLKGTVKFVKTDIKGTLKIKNIFGRIDIKYNLSGSVEIDSRIGTYNFANVCNLSVLGSAEENGTNNPSITLNNCLNLDYKAEGGLLNINGRVEGDTEVITNFATININTTVKDVYIKNDNGKTNINQVGYLSTNIADSSWNISGAVDDSIKVINSIDGDITIGTSYYNLALATVKGKVTINNTYRKVILESETGAINVAFKNSEPLSSSTINDYINNNLLNILDTTDVMLNIKAKESYIKASNIRSAISINADASQIDLTFDEVKGQNIVKTSSKQVKVKSPLANYVIKTYQNKNSNAKLNLNYASLKIDNYPTPEQVAQSEGKMFRFDEGEFKGARFLINNATASSTNVIKITNTTGAIIASN